ncbi:restriction endonuclease subunit S [Campylobacter jejuni]|nr:restriction endonuclease subunit S [Campylobacter jejuni]EDP4964732.1 restriction endonuclease subunit S [Campylobacter jejuni]MEA8935532.1 restriction endonuclease subunit S [Campylobacter jejuni]MEA8949688.1 restriction endonuclease subunit S [Campylobacter jejuni]MEA8969805.1 restriction endonuclease subunit S [Campylobacter jejuni]MEA8972235.1 restriction endonuclease subunit S [Campylobacter jejuni]
MSKFTKVKLKDCATFINGMAFKPIDWDVKGLPIVRIQNLTGTNKNFNYYSKEYNPKFEINNGDLLISWSASLGVFVWNDGKAILNQHIFKVVFDKIEINKKYFYFCILDVLEEMSEKTHGSAMRHITKGDFDNIEIPLPPLKEQKRIVGILDESFAKIDESIKILEQNLLNLDELMQSALQKAFNPLKDNSKENYQLPQGWEWKSLGEICEINPRNKVDDEINISFISMDKILDGYNNEFSYAIKKWKDVKKGFTHFKQGDIGLAKITPCFENKKSVIFNNLENGIGAGTTELHIIRVGNYIISKFLLWFFKTEKFIKNGILNMTGATGHKRVPKDFIKNLQIPLPPLQEQEQIAKHLDFVFEKAKALKELYTKELKDYEELKQSLLDKAFKGEL